MCICATPNMLAAAAAKRRSATPASSPRPYKVMQSLAAITASVVVPAHGVIVAGFTHRNVTAIPMRSQVWTFAKHLLKGCLWAAAIAAGMLVYTAFVSKWKEQGFPTIPISALVAIDQGMQGMQGRAPGPSNVIPLAGIGAAQGTPASSARATATATRQTTLLEENDFEG